MATELVMPAPDLNHDLAQIRKQRRALRRPSHPASSNRDQQQATASPSNVSSDLSSLLHSIANRNTTSMSDSQSGSEASVDWSFISTRSNYQPAAFARTWDPQSPAKRSNDSRNTSGANHNTSESFVDAQLKSDTSVVLKGLSAPLEEHRSASVLVGSKALSECTQNN